jgi:alginate O-acetyltransferase complex protein AlgI
MATMVLGGLWHGAAWTFVCWGAIHGAALVLNHAWIEAWQDRPGTAPCAPTPTPAPALWHRLGRAAGGLATFAVVCLAWVVFRSPDIETALAFYRGMAGLVDAPLARLADLDPPFDVTALHVTLADAALIAWLLPRSRQIVAAWWPVPRRWSRAAPWRRCVLALAMGLGLGLLLTCSVYRLGVYSPFLYFQF